ncbi:MAG: hypothetical protein AB7L84_12080 [Acidimicrobiia bacterium]
MAGSTVEDERANEIGQLADALGALLGPSRPAEHRGALGARWVLEGSDVEAAADRLHLVVGDGRRRVAVTVAHASSAGRHWPSYQRPVRGAQDVVSRLDALLDGDPAVTSVEIDLAPPTGIARWWRRLRQADWRPWYRIPPPGRWATTALVAAAALTAGDALAGGEGTLASRIVFNALAGVAVAPSYEAVRERRRPD